MFRLGIVAMSGRALCSAAAAVIVALAVTGCDVASPDPAACKAALQAEFLKAEGSEGLSFGPVPKACKGLPRSEVQQFIKQVMEGR
jgi:hypothetical protein